MMGRRLSLWLMATLVVVWFHHTSGEDAVTTETAADVTTTTTDSDNNIDDDDGYEWPTLYDAIDDMLDSSLLIYAFASIRDVARNETSHFVDAKRFLQLPITAKEVFRILAENEANLKTALEQASSVNVVKGIIKTLYERQKSVEGVKKLNATASSATLLHFSDVKGEEKDLVYAIGIDQRLKRVTVCFRGTVSDNDILTDLNFFMARIDNPVADIDGQPSKIRLHSGFYHYLFADITHEDPKIKTKCALILRETIAALKGHPGFRLFITGHSLGGALSALFAFHAAAAPDEDIPKPVVCISIASPYVGGSNWKAAHQYLESAGKLQYIRVANHKDYVTIAPPFALNFGLYKHVGTELKLLQNSRMEMTYSKGFFWKRLIGNSFFANFNFRPLTNHGTEEYDRRLASVQEELQSIPLIGITPINQSHPEL